SEVNHPGEMCKDCNKLRIRKMEKLPYIPTSQQTIGTVEHGVLLRRPTTPMSPPLVLQKGTSRPHFHLPHKSIMLWFAPLAGLALLYRCNAVDTYHCIQGDLPPKLDDILGPIGTFQVQASHSDIPMMTVTPPFSSGSIPRLNEEHTSHDPNSLLNSMDHHDSFQAAADLPDPWDNFFSVCNNDMFQLMKSWEEIEEPWVTFLENNNTGPPSSSSQIPPTRLNDGFVPHHEVALQQETMSPNQNFSKFEEIFPRNIYKTSKSSMIDSPTTDNEQAKVSLPSCFSNDGFSSYYDRISVLLEDRLENSDPKRRKKNSTQLDGNNQLQKDSLVQYATNSNPSEYRFSESHSKKPTSGLESPLRTLKFDRSVFKIEDPSSLDTFRIKKITSLIGNFQKNVLKININSPEDTCEMFKRAMGRGNTQTDRYYSTDKESYKKRRERKNSLLNKAFKEFSLKRESWSKFYKEKSGVESKDLNIYHFKRIKIDSLEAHFLLFLFYADMISSILVQNDHPNGKEPLPNDNRDIIQRAAKNYKCYYAHLLPGATLPVGKQTFLDAVWLEVEGWLKHETEKEIYDILFQNTHTKKKSSHFFHAVFSYSITNLGRRISGEQKYI
ncbi:hypothetical protein PGT21_016982, partial [Puccinia graminis f. sp. tritici]